METITIGMVKATLESQMESEEPDQILEILKKEDGKQLTKRLLAKMPGGADRWMLREIAGMTHLEDRDYRREGGSRGISLLMRYHGSGPAGIDAKWVEEHNAAYFSARKERNALRHACLNGGVKPNGDGEQIISEPLDQMAGALNEVRRCRAALDLAEQRLATLIGWGEPFSPDSTTWEKMSGKERDR